MTEDEGPTEHPGIPWREIPWLDLIRSMLSKGKTADQIADHLDWLWFARDNGIPLETKHWRRADGWHWEGE